MHSSRDRRKRAPGRRARPGARSVIRHADGARRPETDQSFLDTAGFEISYVYGARRGKKVTGTRGIAGEKGLRKYLGRKAANNEARREGLVKGEVARIYGKSKLFQSSLRDIIRYKFLWQ